MPVLTYTPAAQVVGPLTAAGLWPTADKGDPQQSKLVIAPDGAGKVGVWECLPGGFPIVDRPDTEICHVLSGAAVVTDEETGEQIHLAAGDVVTFPVGWSGRWDITETLRKVYVIF